MLTETNAIVLRTIKYSETSVIAHIYTEQFGNGSYIMNNVRTNHSKMAMFQPLSFVHISVVRKKTPKQIHRITNISFQLVPTDITANVFKSTIALFVGEITDKVFNEEERCDAVFQYLKSFVFLLEESKTNFANLHILYLLHLTRFLGFFPQNNFTPQTNIFSLLNSQFISPNGLHENLSLEQSRLFSLIINSEELTDVLELNRQERQQLLDILLLYYDYHICKTQQLTSLGILKMVFE